MLRIKNQLTEFISNCMHKFNFAETKNQGLKTLQENSGRFDSFVYLWNNSYDKSAVRTSLPLSFSNYFSFGSSMKFIMKLTGKPAFVLENSDCGMDILVYIMQIRGCDVRFELHFHEQKLYFINYTYFGITDIEKENVIKSLAEKYQIGLSSTNIFDQIVIDNEGNGLLFEDNGNFSLNYLAPSSKVDSISQSFLLARKHAM